MKDEFEHTDPFRLQIRAILFNAVPEILIVKHQNERWIFPGGGLEGAERQPDTNLIPILREQTLWRELKEEIGINDDTLSWLKNRPRIEVCWLEWWNGDRKLNMARLDLIEAIYLGPKERIVCQPQKEDKIVDTKWYPLFGHFPPFEGIWPENTNKAISKFRRAITGNPNAHPFVT